MAEPIAIVGRACLLPGAPDPAALARAVLGGADLLRDVPPGRWRLDPARLRGAPPDRDDRTWSLRGGYVDPIRLDPGGLRVPAERLAGLDPVFTWTLHVLREALRDAGRPGAGAGVGAVLGNLSFPTLGLAQHAAAVWLGPLAAAAGVPATDPRDRFMSGLPARLAAEALDLRAGATCLDAACASGLYAVGLACEALRAGRADLMLAGAVNAADDLFLHMGFTALAALSPSGRSRPFHREADGLVPAEGAAAVALRRLSDAERAGDRILGVIRGVGLGNDGRGRGLLAPCPEGQVIAMRRAYAQAGLDPRAVGLLECHATGTLVGDAAELESAAEVFAGHPGLPIGSIKSNLGHALTVAGLAGLLKVLACLEAGARAPTLHADDPTPALRGAPLRLLTAREPWPADAPRVAAVSAFGFGGNNAHLVVEAWRPAPRPRAPEPPAASDDPVAIVGVGVRVGDCDGADEFVDLLLDPTRPAPPARMSAVRLPRAGLRFPPADLRHALGQQTAVLAAAIDAMAARVGAPSGERAGVIVGIGCDPEVARAGARWRSAAWADALAADAGWAARAADGCLAPLRAPDVLGMMPNLVANRLSSHFDLLGPGFTVSAEEASGLVALAEAARLLRRGEVDTMIAAAVDLSCEPVHAAALAALGRPAAPADAAVAVVLRRLADARRDGESILAILPAEPGPRRPDAPGLLDLGDALGVERRFGRSHAAAGLLRAAAATLCLHRGALPGPRGPRPWLSEGTRRARVDVDVLGGPPAAAELHAADAAPPPLAPPPPVLAVLAAPDLPGLRAALESDRPQRDGPVRLVLLAADQGALAERRRVALAALPDALPAAGLTLLAPGVYLGHGAAGQLAFVYPGAAAAYPGMGRALALAFPRERDAITRAAPGLGELAGWIFDGRAPATPMHQLWGCSLLCQLHARVLQDVLGLRPAAAIGYSSGETNALFAHGAWTDIAAMLVQTRDDPLFRSELCGPADAAQRAWRRAGLPPGAWENWCVAAPVARVREALAGEPQAHLTIVNTANDCVIGGHADACRRVLARLPGAGVRPLGYAIVAHAPELAEAEQAWRALHRRPTCPIAQPRIYGAATASAYAPSEAAAEEALLGQAIRTLDFPAVIERAHADGVRVFLELGPRGLCRGWIDEILADRPHLALALDRPGQDALHALWDCVAGLVAAGVPVDLAALRRALPPARPPASPRDLLELPARRPPVVLPPLARPDPKDLAPKPPSPGRRDPLAPTRRPPPDLPDPKDMSPKPSSPAPLPRPPRLPRVADLRDPPAHLDDPPAAPAPTLLRDPSPAPAPTQPRDPSAAPAPALAAALASGMHAVTATHRVYLATQAATQRRFLALAAATRPPPAAMPAPRPARPADTPSPLVARSDAPRIEPSPLVARANTPHIEPAPLAAAVDPTPRRPGPAFTRQDLEELSRGRISRHFGPMFARQDHHARQVRMPTPPLLLADRVTGIDGEPGSLGRGTIWTETDVRPDAWYLHDGVMPAGLVVEAGQADLLLLSWLGVDFENQGERVYRLLGCELTYYGVPVRPGDTLAYEIHIDGYARQGGVRLAFFRHDCTVGGALRMRVTHGRAGFFTDAELAQSQGVLWDPHTAPHDPHARLDPPAVRCLRRAFTREQIAAFADGDAATCFGPGFERARTHTRTPRIARGDLQLIHAVTDFDPAGGPWRRGYLRATYALTADTWFFPSHFAGDPCMPGTLMCEGLMQAMAVYLTALGATLPRDGWRFEPVPEVSYQLRCRGQVTPASREVVYEVFVAEHHAGPIPTLIADILCSVDGLRAFHCRRMGLRLVPDWPLTSMPPLPAPDDRPVAVHDGLRFDHASLLACAWGPPTAAFGPRFAAFDGPRRLARLPGPPYHFMSRVVALDERRIGAPAGAFVEVDYDIPPDAWYFEGPRPHVPFAVLLEVALQPCGWLAMAHGTAVRAAEDLHFRNLDGQATLHADLGPDAGTVRTRVEHLGTADSGGITLVQFAVTCSVGGRRVLDVRTGFGFFPAAALAQQAGLPLLPEHRRWRDEPCDAADLGPAGDAYRPLRPVPSGMLRMLDRITGWWPDAGAAGLGRARAELDIDAGQWFFKAHFFQDPVMPGSLGLQAMLQLLRWVMIRRGLDAGLADPRFEAVPIGEPIAWSYRGQIAPETTCMAIDLEVLQVERGPHGATATATATLWADGVRIYQATRLAARIVEAAAEPALGEAARTLVRADGRPALAPVRQFWAGRTGLSGWLVEDLVLGLVRRYVGRIHLPDGPLPRGALLLANHEVAVESLLFCPLYGAWSGSPTVALAKAEHRTSWLGGLMTLARSRPDADVPSFLAFFDRSDRAALPALLEQLAREVLQPGGSLLIHVEGTRARTCRHRPQRVGAAVLDLAIRHRLPVVPVRFVGGLPVAPTTSALDLPFGHSAQDIHVGAPIAADELAALPLAERAARVLAAISDLGPDPDVTLPSAPDREFAAAVARRARESGAPEVVAAMLETLRRCPEPCAETRALLGDTPLSALPGPLRRWLESVPFGRSPTDG